MCVHTPKQNATCLLDSASQNQPSLAISFFRPKHPQRPPSKAPLLLKRLFLSDDTSTSQDNQNPHLLLQVHPTNGSVPFCITSSQASSTQVFQLRIRDSRRYYFITKLLWSLTEMLVLPSVVKPLIPDPMHLSYLKHKSRFLLLAR